MTGPDGTTHALDPRSLAVLELERSWWLHGGSKAAVIHARLGISASTYYRLRDELLDDPAAMVHDPLVVKRLRRQRDDRRRRRFEGPSRDRGTP